MSEHSRRTFLKRASIGTAAVGATALLPSTAADATTPETSSGPAYDGPFTVWVKNARTGEVAVLAGEHEIVHHDPVLAKKLARLAARGQKA